MSKVIGCVGLVCVDLINLCEAFPDEDTDQRVLSLHWQRGGNAGNNCVTLALLGSEVEFIGTVPNCHNTAMSWASTAARFAVEDMKKHGVGVGNIVYCTGDEFPTSSVIVNAKNGSRTILHSRGNLPEVSLEDFAKLDLNCYHWMHFELRRNVETIIEAMNMVRKFNDELQSKDKVVVSIEFEKVRKQYGLIPAKFADLVFVSKDYACHMGWESALQAVEEMKQFLSPGCSVVCCWGSEGAAYATKTESDVGKEVKAREVKKLVATLGGGDAFIGAVIHSMSKGRPIGESVEFGCRVAERKISDFGFRHIKGMELPP